MTAARRTMAEPPEAWTKRLVASRDRVLAAARAWRHGEAMLTQATAGRIVTAWTLDPAPVDPVAHLEQTHPRGRRHLRRLLDQPVGAEVRSPMTSQLFDRLTQPAHPAQRKKIDYTSVDLYTYAPRKPLLRVLDHTLDHLNQIDQWGRWRRVGVVPTPTDGWVPSTVTLPEDRLPLTAQDLDGWLWRIDQARRLLTQRASALSPRTSTGSRRTEDGRSDASSAMSRARSCCTPRPSTRRCPPIRPPGTPRPTLASASASSRHACLPPTHRSSFPIHTARSSRSSTSSPRSSRWNAIS